MIKSDYFVEADKKLYCCKDKCEYVGRIDEIGTYIWYIPLVIGHKAIWPEDNCKNKKQEGK